MCTFDILQTKKPLVSVLIASYCSGEPLFHALKSVLEQDYENLEVLICDDGTEDFPTDRLQELIRTQKQTNCILIQQPVNIGTVKNLNCGLHRANGQWIMPMAADDILASPCVVSAMMAQVLSSERQWILPQTALCDNTLTRRFGLLPHEDTQQQIHSAEAETLYEQVCFQCCLPASGAIYQRDLLKKHGYFDERYRLVEDWPLFLKLLRQNILPAVSETVFVLHRGAGTSEKCPQKNKIYQQDLINVMEYEILPYLSTIADKKRQKQLLRQIQDKKAIFEYRFACDTASQRLSWLVRNGMVVFRKITKKCRGGRPC